MSKKVYVGFDGGGTKSKLLILAEDGTIVEEHLFPGCNINQIGVDGLNSIFSQVSEKLAKYAVVYAVFGVPGYDENHQINQQINQVFQSYFQDKFKIYNDVVVAQFGASNLSPGIHVVAGTGSMVVYISESTNKRVGGFGPLIGDEGSAYWIGSKAVNAISKHFDTRTECQLLVDLVSELGIIDSDSLINYIYNNVNYRTQIADISLIVDQAANLGDDTSLMILDSAANELFDQINTLLKGSSEARGTTFVTYSGSVFKSQILVNKLDSLLQANKIELKSACYQPEFGAAFKAMELFNK